MHTLCVSRTVLHNSHGEWACHQRLHKVFIDVAICLDRDWTVSLSSQHLYTQWSISLKNTPTPLQLKSTGIPSAEHESHVRERCCLYCGLSGHFQVACSELLGKALSSAVSCSNGYPLLIKDYSFNQYHFFSGLCGLRCGSKFHGNFPRQEAQYFLWVPSFSPGYYCPGQEITL